MAIPAIVQVKYPDTLNHFSAKYANPIKGPKEINTTTALTRAS